MIVNNSAVVPCSEYRPKVLIAQSNESDLRKISSASDLFGQYDYELCDNGHDVIDAVNNYCFDAVVLGLKFPDITGSTLAYLINQFDPLISIAFLTYYTSRILATVADDLNCQFWTKPDKFDNMELLCNDIYTLAIKMPCDNEKRIIKREYVRENRETFRKYHQLAVPTSIAELVSRQR